VVVQAAETQPQTAQQAVVVVLVDTFREVHILSVVHLLSQSAQVVLEVVQAPME
jgi:hypothetical protein